MNQSLNTLETIAMGEIEQCEIVSTGNEWSEFQKLIKEEIKAVGLENFLQCKTIEATMNYMPDKKELDYLLNSEYTNFYKKAIIEDNIGNPSKLDYYPLSSGNLIHHCYALSQFINFLNSPFFITKVSTVFEFGPGYGSFCRLLLNIGFKGTYILYDVKLLTIVQWYFLNCYKCIHTSDYSHSFSNIIKINQTINIQLNNNTLKQEESLNDFEDLFVALWSFSEIGFDERDKLVEKIKRAKFVIIGFQHFFNSYNNLAYFKKLVKFDKSKKYNFIKIHHIPDNYYLFAKPKEE